MEGDVDEARRRCEDGKKLSTGIGFQEGVTRADELLEELKKKWGWSWMKDAKSLWYEYVGMCNAHLYENFLATSVE
ncbi:MAG: hypothetical protein Q9175_006315 [Cornicularia normoerica]